MDWKGERYVHFNAINFAFMGDASGSIFFKVAFKEKWFWNTVVSSTIKQKNQMLK